MTELMLQVRHPWQAGGAGLPPLWRTPDGSELAKHPHHTVAHCNQMVGTMRDVLAAVWSWLGPVAVTAPLTRRSCSAVAARTCATSRPLAVDAKGATGQGAVGAVLGCNAGGKPASQSRIRPPDLKLLHCECETLAVPE